MSAVEITIHPPSSTHPSLSEGTFDRSWFMGKWGVAWSTLPMWKGKKDVTITYTPIAGTENHTKFEDLVEYKKESAAEGSKPSTVKGVDTLTTGANAATFDWKGSSYLFFVHSHWEVLGFGKDEINGLEWAVTFFSKTLFTPAGIDIYLRSPSSASSEPNPSSQDTTIRSDLVKKIVSAMSEISQGGVSELARSGFEVPGIV
ncbi:hypothetical protein I203_104072 [Kwoniella mangroviensis CBS 8507]|uniref:uncharacterized protein n=1 Tax=Kwoniella mangroviensis CBS 8507 TaxID=1296122 RepID=UPI00080D40EC|nr:uncharacterized protein I203_06378 [Kwoniella mangroviensis CBS 8507]OCF64643.1 hypothetical protein I203_06378 [Kwoniella mangroviensis CBS 8507]